MTCCLMTSELGVSGVHVCLGGTAGQDVYVRDRKHWLFTGLGARHDDTNLCDKYLFGYRSDIIFP